MTYVAGEIVIANPRLSSLPCSDSTDHNMQEIPGLYPACTVTRSMAKKAEKQPPSVPDKQAFDQLGKNCSTSKPSPQSGSCN